MFAVVLADAAREFYERSNASMQRRLDRCFDRLRQSPQRGANIKPLKGALSGLWRYRVGDYRVVYKIEPARRTVIVLLIEHRRQVYD